MVTPPMAEPTVVKAAEVREGDLVALQGERRRVVEGNIRAGAMRELRVRGIGTWHFRSDENVTVWRNWGFQ